MKVYHFTCEYSNGSGSETDIFICPEKPKYEVISPATFQFSSDNVIDIDFKFKYKVTSIGADYPYMGVDPNCLKVIINKGPVKTTYDIKSVIKYSIRECEIDCVTAEEASEIVNKSKEETIAIIKKVQDDVYNQEVVDRIHSNRFIKFIAQIMKII